MKKKGLPIEARVILTSLVDAFSILVIYLLMNFSTQDLKIEMKHDVNLPSASKVMSLSKVVVVKIKKDIYYIDDKKIASGALFNSIKRKLRTTPLNRNELIIQADKKQSYKNLSPIIQAAAQLGIEKMKFAALVR